MTIKINSIVENKIQSSYAYASSFCSPGPDDDDDLATEDLDEEWVPQEAW